MLCGCGNHEMITKEYAGILLAKEMYARGVEFITE